MLDKASKMTNATVLMPNDNGINGIRFGREIVAAAAGEFMFMLMEVLIRIREVEDVQWREGGRRRRIISFCNRRCVTMTGMYSLWWK